MVIDPSSEQGSKVTRWLQDDIVAWLVTVTPDGTPVPTPVWFWWDGESLLIYSQPDKPKLRHIATNPRVALALPLDEAGDLRAVVTGDAAVDQSAPAAFEVPEYLAKYQGEIERMGSNPEEFSGSYSVPIRVVPTRLRSW